MKVLIVEPDFEPYEAEISGLEEMQSVVGGSLQAIYPFEELVTVVCNEDGRNLKLPFNRSMERGYGGVFGTFFVCGIGKEDFCSLTQEQTERYKAKFYKAEILIARNGRYYTTLLMPPAKHPKGRPAPNKGKDRRTPPDKGRT